MPDSPYSLDLVTCLLTSHLHLTGQPLLERLPGETDAALAARLYAAAFVVLAHGTEPDPLFNYANLAAQALFERDWDEFIGLPSRLSAEAPVRGPDGLCIEAANDEPGEALGEIRANSRRYMFEGYSGDQAQTNKKILRDVFAKGDAWFRTGDLLKRDRDAYFYFVDRIGDTFRWKGENVSTTEVEEAIGAFAGALAANVYGVHVPGRDGRAGMAAIVTEPSFNLAAFREHLTQRLPEYARPVFLRLRTNIEMTSTFKTRKVDLVQQGFDPRVIEDPIYVNDPAAKAFVRIDAALYEQIATGKVRL